jgi:5-formyltetrahydrofolate cyclo-ligase
MSHPDKDAARAEIRKRLKMISDAERAAASARIRERIFASDVWKKAGTIGLYVALASEPDLNALLESPGKVFCLPRVGEELMEYHRCDAGTSLSAGQWKILEPVGEDCPLVPVEEIDLLFIPGMAFTRAGERLGRGKGHFDRFLKRIHPRAVKVGVCFAVQIVEGLPVENHDHEVDWIVTEDELIQCG